jgi:MraZ protein
MKWASVREHLPVSHFLGTHRHTLDAKGRLSIPAKFRKATGEVFVVTRGLDDCLFLYPMEAWTKFVEDLMSLRSTSENPRFFMREVAARASEVSVDSHGRIMIPPELRELAGLNRDVLVIGAFERIEIWDPERHEKYREGFGLSFEEAAETLWDKQMGGASERSSEDGKDRQR